MRVPTESRIDWVEEEVSARRARRSDSKAARDPRMRGALVNSWPGRSAAKLSIQLTEETRPVTCQKQVPMPTRNTRTMNPFNHGDDRKTGATEG